MDHSRVSLTESSSEYFYLFFKLTFAHIVSRLTGQQEDTHSDVPDACFVTAPMGVAEALRCEVADALSCLMVCGSEELVSRVIRVKVRDAAKFPFPVTVAVPFCSRYRGNYRDVAVKIFDGVRRVSYVTPLTTEGTYGGQRVNVSDTYSLCVKCFH